MNRAEWQKVLQALNKQHSKTYAKKEKFLRVLERPETPLHNNNLSFGFFSLIIQKLKSGNLWLNGKSLEEHGAIRERGVETLL